MEVSIKNLEVSVSGKKIIDSLNLELKGNEVHVIMGPNGSGKTTLSHAIAGSPFYKVEGEIMINGNNISSIPPDERARRGVFLSFQSPPFIEGITVLQLIKKAYFRLNGIEDNNILEYKKLRNKIGLALEFLSLSEDFLKREINKNFSGGEKKKAEMLQMLVLEPFFIILDEIDSGLDVDSLRIVARAINKMKSKERVFLVITHYNRILKHISPDFVHVMMNGNIIKSGGKELADYIEENGYKF